MLLKGASWRFILFVFECLKYWNSAPISSKLLFFFSYCITRGFLLLRFSLYTVFKTLESNLILIYWLHYRSIVSRDPFVNFVVAYDDTAICTICGSINFIFGRRHIEARGYRPVYTTQLEYWLRVYWSRHSYLFSYLWRVLLISLVLHWPC